MLARNRRRPFVTAQWRYLVMVNYEVDPRLLRPHVPCGTELDYFGGSCLVGIVGFLFDASRLFGRIAIPFHSRFEEVNLRLYVIRGSGSQRRRGVVFIKELAPSRSVRWVANRWFHERYEYTAMRHEFSWTNAMHPDDGGEFRYQWQCNGGWSELTATTGGPISTPKPGSLPEFIIEHYWGYTKRADGGTLEFQVEHPSWRVWPVEACRFETDVAAIYGREFLRPLTATPHSALVADGSSVAVYTGRQIA